MIIFIEKLSPLPGFEPWTSRVPSRCTSNCAIQAWIKKIGKSSNYSYSTKSLKYLYLKSRLPNETRDGTPTRPYLVLSIRNQSVFVWSGILLKSNSNFWMIQLFSSCHANWSRYYFLEAIFSPSISIIIFINLTNRTSMIFQQLVPPDLKPEMGNFMSNNFDWCEINIIEYYLLIRIITKHAYDKQQPL